MGELWAKLRIWAEMIKVEHTLFSAPFLLSAMLLAVPVDVFPSLTTFFWCGVALFAARASAMTFNRVVDARFDLLNPRTAQRAIPQGKLSVRSAIVLTVLGFVVLLIAALQLPTLCLYLFPVAVFWLSFYSFTKRFTYLSHFVLGLALGGAVLGGWIAVTGSLLSVVPWILCLAVAFWTGGFDVLYALQDQEFDRQQGLHSIPAAFGQQRAIWLSRLCHLLSCVLFTLLVFFLPERLQSWYLVACGLMSIGLVSQHWIIQRYPHRTEMAFFLANAGISTLFLCCLLLAKLF